MRIVVVDWDVAYPANSGKRLRTLNLMLQLADRHDITYFSRGDARSAEGSRARQFLQDHGIKTEFANVPIRAKQSWRYYGWAAARLFHELPLTVAAHVSESYAQALRAYAARHEVELWQLEWTPYVDMLRGINPRRTLAVAHNVDTLIWQRYQESESNPLLRWVIRNQHHKFARFERDVFRRATGVVAVSQDDAEILRHRFGVERVDVVDNGVDVAHYEGVSAPRERNELLFLGSLDWRPNLDALQLLLDDILPRVRRDAPEAKLSIVGRHPPDWLRTKVSVLKHVTLYADVPDVRPYLARAGMMVVPLRIGGGSRLKILESLANGLPVVATSVAAEGLRLTPDREYRRVDSPEDFAAAIVHWIYHPHDAEGMARQGHHVVVQHYGWGHLANELETIWEKTAAHPASAGE